MMADIRCTVDAVWRIEGPGIIATLTGRPAGGDRPVPRGRGLDGQRSRTP